MQKKCFGTEEITPLNKIKAKFKKNVRNRSGTIATETLFFSLLGVQTRERCSVGTKVCNIEASIIVLIQYFFFRLGNEFASTHFFFRLRPNWETFCRKKVHQLIAMRAVEIQKMTINREDEKK